MMDATPFKRKLTKRDKRIAVGLTALTCVWAAASLITGAGLPWRLAGAVPLLGLIIWLAAVGGESGWRPSKARLYATINWILWVTAGAGAMLWIVMIGLFATPALIEKEHSGELADGTALAVLITTLIFSIGAFALFADRAGKAYAKGEDE